MQPKHNAVWVVALLAPLALLTLFLTSRSRSSYGTDVAMVPGPPDAGLPPASEPTSSAGASAGPSNELEDNRPPPAPAPRAGAATDTAPYAVHFQVLRKFAPWREPGALVRPSKVVLCMGEEIGRRILECDGHGSVSATLSPFELALATAGRLHCVAVNDDGCSRSAITVAALPTGETRVAVPIDKEWPSCLIDLSFDAPDGITDGLEIRWEPMWALSATRERGTTCEHGTRLNELAKLDGESGQISRLGRNLPRRIRLVGIADGLTQLDVAVIRRNPYRELRRTALVRSGERVLIDFDRSLTEHMVTLAVAADGPAAAPGALEFAVIQLGQEPIPQDAIGQGPRAEMKLSAPGVYWLRVKEAGTDFTCRSLQFGLDASGHVVHASKLLSVTGDNGHEAITVALGRRLEITPQRLRELRALCDCMEIEFEGNGLPTYAVNSASPASPYTSDLDTLSSMASNVRVYAPDGSKIIGRSFASGARPIMLDIGRWFQE